MYNIIAKPRVAPEKTTSYRPGFAFVQYKKNTKEVSMNDPIIIKLCKVDGCENPQKKNSRLCCKHKSRWDTYKCYDKPSRKKAPAKNTDPCNYIPAKDLVGKEIVKVCGQHGPLTEEFARHQKFTKKSGLKYYWICKLCAKENSKKIRNTRREIFNNKIDEEAKLSVMCDRQIQYNKMRYSEMKRKGGEKYSLLKQLKLHKMSEEQHDKMILDQNNKCAICLNPETRKQPWSDKTSRLVIDHCHETKKVRGLLCAKCNSGIGYLKDSIDLLKSAISYLEKHK